MSLTQVEADAQVVRPTLTVNVRLKGSEIVDASLNPASRLFFEKIASELASTRQSSSDDDMDDIGNRATRTSEATKQGQVVLDETTENGDFETIEVPLVFDSQFFEILHSDVNSIDNLQAKEQKKMHQEITDLGSELSQITKPSRFHKTDLEPWRYILELYVDAEVFFATREQDHGARSSQQALKQLQWFQTQVEKKKFTKNFKLHESQAAFVRFLHLNASLLKYLQFQELNQLAVRKILKSMLSMFFKAHIHLPSKPVLTCDL